MEREIPKGRAARASGWAKRWAAMADPESTIVAEVSQNWIGGEAQPMEGVPIGVSRRFEHVIAVNGKRGYLLRDWQLSRVVIGAQINETIVAVFEHRRLPSKVPTAPPVSGDPERRQDA